MINKQHYLVNYAFNEGDIKNTYGTGCFCMMNTGENFVMSKNKMLSTIAWRINGEITYALEGSVFVAGALIQWLRDQLGIIKSSPEVEELAKTVNDNGGLTFVPALSGLAAHIGIHTFKEQFLE